MLRSLLFLVPLVTCLFARADDVIWPEPQAPPGVPAAQFPKARVDQMNQFVDHLHRARLAPVDLVFDGDSITEWWQPADRGGPLFDKLYGPRHVIDFGVAGDGTQHILWRLAHGELDGLHPKLIMFMGGTNNTGNCSPEDIAAADTQIVQTYRKDCPDAHILLLGIFPRGAPNDPVRDKIKAVNAMISRLDDGRHVTYLDIGDKFLQPDGSISPEIFADGLHPTLKGYQIWADAVAPVIDQYCPPPPAGTPPPAPVQATAQQIAAINATIPTLTWPYEINPPPGTPFTLFPMAHCDWPYQFAQKLAQLKAKPYDFIIDGDSIALGWQRPDAGGPVLAQRYGGRAFVSAMDGDQVQNVLWRAQHGDLDGQHPRLIMVMVGGDNYGQAPADVSGGFRKLLDEYQTRCPDAHILLMGLLPREHDANAPSRAWVKQVNAIISRYDRAGSAEGDPCVTYIDIGDKFLLPDGTINGDLMPDNQHPSAKGFAVWADAIQPLVDQYAGKPASP